MLHAGRKVAGLLVALAIGACPAASAGPVGVRIYIDRWNPLQPTAKSFQTFFDDPTLISRTVSDAWDKSLADTTADIVSAMAERDIGDGFRTYNSDVVLHPVSDFSISTTRGGGALVKATIPQISITTSFRTPGPAPNGTDPRFSVTADIVVSVDLEPGGKGQVLRAASVSTFIQNLNGPTPLNDSAKAITDAADIANAMAKFVTGWDFKNMLIASLTSQDLTKNRFQPTIDSNLQILNNNFAAVPGIDLLLVRKAWADHNRLTLYFAPRPLPGVPQTGRVTGTIRWDAASVRGQCADLAIAASVQIGPEPLLDSDASSFGSAPTMPVGQFQATPTGPSLCSYTLAYLGAGMPNALQATSTRFGTVNPHGSASHYVGGLRTATVILGDGWDGLSVTPDATNRNYIVVDAMSAGKPVGKLKPVEKMHNPDPGDEHTAPPGASTQASPASKVELNPQPLPPRTTKKGLGSQ